jgi:hypothetical protein
MKLKKDTKVRKHHMLKQFKRPIYIMTRESVKLIREYKEQK